MEVKVAGLDGSGNGGRAITAVWAGWMGWAIPRIRSAVLATRPLRPYAHQDDAVFGAMLSQPRLRFLLADEPGTGKTLMTGMYLAEGRRRGLIPGKTVIVVPAHLVEKWIRELRRFFGIEAHRGHPGDQAAIPLDLRADVDVWVVSGPLHLQPRRTSQGGRRPERPGRSPYSMRLTGSRRPRSTWARPRSWRDSPPPAVADRHPAPRQGALLPGAAEPAGPRPLSLGQLGEGLRRTRRTRRGGTTSCDG